MRAVRRDEPCGCADLGTVGSLAVGGSKPGAATEIIFKSVVCVAAQHGSTGTGSCPGSCLSSVHHTYAAALAGCRVWLAARSVKTFGRLPEPDLYSYRIMELTLWGILHHSVWTAIPYVPFLFYERY